MKPQIIRWRHPDGRIGWRCWQYRGATCSGIGITPDSAYTGWLAAMETAQRFGIK